MKMFFLAVVFSGLSFNVFAQQNGFSPDDPQKRGGSGFQNPGAGVTTVDSARMMRDDSWVVLEGTIIRQVEHELYEFRDSSGSVLVDIDDSDWMGQSASPGSRVRLEGDVDTDFSRVEINVKRVSVIR